MRALFILCVGCFPLWGGVVTEVLADYSSSASPGEVIASCQQVGEAQSTCSAGPVVIAASADYGVLSVLANSAYGASVVFAISEFDDQLRIDTAGGGNGFVQFLFTINTRGSDENSGPACVPAGIEVFQDDVSLGTSPVISINSCSPPYDGLITTSFTTASAPFTSTVPFALSTQAFLFTSNPQGSDPHLGAFNTTLDASLVGISLFDSNGQALSGSVFSASSSYGGLAVLTPEPSFALPAFMLLICMAAMRLSPLRVWLLRRRTLPAGR